MKLRHATLVCLVVATAAAQHAFLPPNLMYWVPLLRQPALSHAPLTRSISTPASDVITQGLHLGNDEEEEESGYANDAPASVITQGPRPGAYTAVSSDEPSESTQFHSQDGLGQFLFGHSSPQQARLETRSADGNVRGSYSYINPEGRTIKVSYTAGEGGFQAVEDDKENGVFPKPVTDTPEVKAARALHARLFDQAKWLADNSPEEDEPSQHADAPVSAPAYNPPSVPAVSHPGAESDYYHPPDSLYTNVGSMGVESDEGLEYYGAAKGTPITKNSPSPVNKVPYAQTGAYHFPDYSVGVPEVRSPLSYSGAYQFPEYRTENKPVLSAYSAPSLREQQHLHRAAPDIKDMSDRPDTMMRYSAYSAPSLREQQHLHRAAPDIKDVSAYSDSMMRYSAYSAPVDVNSREQQHLHRAAPAPESIPEGLKFTPYSAPNPVNTHDLYRAAFGSFPQVYSAFHTDYLPRATLDALEYYGAAKLLSYSNLLNTNEKTSGRRSGKSVKLPSVPNTVIPQGPRPDVPNTESLYSSYRQYSPVYVAVAPQPESDDVPSTRTALDEPRPVVPAASVSQKAAYFGAVPVAAVHDAQVAPGQQVKDHQKLPVYIEAN